ncbi:MAG TPA: histidine kinase [Solirubrobacteraceae bacterium]|nr:histidine kinase [Solirubrobacteraceae bacterium]
MTTALGWRLPDWLLDIGPVAFIFFCGAVALAADNVASGFSRGALLLGLLASSGALLLRHRSPLGVLAVVLALALAMGWGPVVVLPVMLAVFTVAEYSERRQVIVATVVTAAVLLASQVVHHIAFSSAGVVARVVIVGLAVAVGLYFRARADYINGLRERAERLEREHELLAQQAVAEERVRIARELHDVVAHNVSLMVVQAQALAATNGGAQDVTLHRVADLGREALSEMHRMLGLLRIQENTAAEREPQPGVRDLDALIARTREAGLDASLVIEGEPRELPAAIDLSVYRIAQEALTNVIRHAAATHAVVTLAYTPGALEVTVLDDGAGPADAAIANGVTAGGHGLVGMRERVALFGGDLETGRRGYGQGYRVRALLPVS